MASQRKFMPVYLLEVEIENFKSFYGKSLLKGLKNFNSIVGPNGCGKSNFMDALSFVLCASTRKLRVNKVQDLIYKHLLDNICPQTAAVEATFKAINSNNEEQILLFARIITQSSTEYKFNNKTVSKMDYNEKLNLYGLNVQFQNFLIFQGDIDKIALQDPQSLMRYFEYISGSNYIIEEYNRINNEYNVLLAELKKLDSQVTMNKRAQKNAESTTEEHAAYLGAKRDYDELNRRHGILCLYLSDNEIKDLQTKLSEIEEAFEIHQKQAQVVKDELTTKRNEQGRESHDVSVSDDTLRQMEKKSRETKLLVIKAKEELEHVTQKVEDGKAQIKKLWADEKEADKKSSELNKNKTEINTKRDNMMEIVGVDSQVLTEYLRLKNDASKKRAALFDIPDLERQQSADLDLLDRDSRELDILQQCITAYSERIQMAADEKRRLTEALKENLPILTKRQQDSARINEEQEELQLNISAVQKQFINNQEELANMVDSKYDMDRKKVLTALKANYSGIFGLVSDCCEVRDAKYKVAVMKVVGKRHMNAIIVDTEATAQRCIRFLRNHKHSPETFLPINFVKVPYFKKLDGQDAAQVILLKDTLKYDERYENVMAFICKGTYVSGIETVTQFLYDKRINVVTLEGTYYQRSGLISGGSADLQQKANRWNSNRISKLTEEQGALQQQLDTYNKKLNDVTVNNKQTESSISISQQTNRITMMQEAITKNENELTHLKNQLQQFKTKSQTTKQAIAGHNARMEKRATPLAEVENKETEVFRSFCEARSIENIAAFETAEERIFQLDQQLMEIRTNLQCYENTKQINRVKMADLQQRVVENLQNKAAIVAHHAELSAILKEETLRINEAKVVRESKLKDLETVDVTVAALLKKQGRLNDKIGKNKTESLRIQNQIDMRKHSFCQLFKKFIMYGIDIPLQSGDAELSEETGYYDRVQVDYSDLPERYRNLKTFDDKGTVKVLQDLNTELKQLLKKKESASSQLPSKAKEKDHDVTRLQQEHSAIDEVYAQCSERMITLRNRLKDIKDERNGKLSSLLDQVIQVIDPMLSAITEDVTGTASLLFEDELCPFEGGIIYEIIMPQKAYMPLALLSGGERTIAALVLLLALQKCTRSPMLFLDEIDVNLDLTYAMKLFRYLKTQAHNDLQVFCISHHNGIYIPTELAIGITKRFIPIGPFTGEFIILDLEAEVVALQL